MIGYFDIVIELCMNVAKLHDIQESLCLVAELDALLFCYFGFFVGLLIWTDVDALFENLAFGLVVCVRILVYLNEALPHIVSPALEVSLPDQALPRYFTIFEQLLLRILPGIFLRFPEER